MKRALSINSGYSFIFIFAFISIFFLSDYFILGSYAEIEKKQNNKNLSNSIANINHYILNIENSVYDHASWDDTYAFIENRNNEYIVSNFSEDSGTLENLNIDFLLFADKNNNIVYKTFTKSCIFTDDKVLEQKVLTAYIDKNDFTTIIKYKDAVFIIIKKPILRTDNSGEINGHIISATLIDTEAMQRTTTDFKDYKSFNKELTKTSLKEYKGGSVSFDLLMHNTKIENLLNFYDLNNKFVTSVSLSNNRDMYNHGEKTILYFNTILLLLILIIIAVIYKIQKLQEGKAKYKDEVKTKFLANMSHELRTPLNAINGFTELLIEDENNSKKLEYLHVVNNSAQHMLFMINDILNFAKIEENKLSIKKTFFELKKELLNITLLIDYFAKRKDIKFICNYENLPNFISTDSVRLNQVLINILNNAIKFTNYGGEITLNISYNKDVSTLDIYVKDNGIGIDNEKFETIFNRFEQVDSRVTKEYEGTGLGLAISLKIVQLLGGKTIEVESEKSVGTKFSFSIPVTVDEKKNSSKTDDTITKPLYKGISILLVEDNPSNQKFMGVILKRLDVNYDIAENGQIAVEKFKQHKYDIILMDENMPVMSGTDATKKILKIEKEQELKHTPIVALTANALEGDREIFLSVGMDEYLSKPVKKDQLVKIFELLLNK
jgi:signal transduction histidine kinase/CheY-like chemotaxis protein